MQRDSYRIQEEQQMNNSINFHGFVDLHHSEEIANLVGTNATHNGKDQTERKGSTNIEIPSADFTSMAKAASKSSKN
jgi:hypothetical protein